MASKFSNFSVAKLKLLQPEPSHVMSDKLKAIKIKHFQESRVGTGPEVAIVGGGRF